LKNSFLLSLILIWISYSAIAQVGINTDGSQPDNSAMLDVKSTSKGILLPRMTRLQRDAITTPADGLMIYCTTCGSNGALSLYTNGGWTTFSPCSVSPPASGSHLVSPGQIIWNWLMVTGADGYKWNTVPDIETAMDMGTSLSKTETGTSCGTGYTRYICAYNSCGESTMTSLTQAVPGTVPASPVPGAHGPGQNSIQWNWSGIPDIPGYKWNTSNNLSSAVDVGASTSRTESGLVCGTSYTRYVWAYNGCGYSVPAVLTQSTLACLNCGQAFTDARDGKSYNTVQIGAQCWMGQNLNIGTRINGLEDQTDNDIIEKYCYDDSELNCNTYGGLYQWNEMMQYIYLPGEQGICPDGWHNPTDDEWSALVSFLGGEGVAGGKMKETGTSHWASPNTGASNSSAFSALPGGNRDEYGSFTDLTYTGNFWSSAENTSAEGAWNRYMGYYFEDIVTSASNKANGFSVRCVKNN